MAAIAGFMPTRCNASQMAASPGAEPKGSRLLRTVPVKSVGSCTQVSSLMLQAPTLLRHGARQALRTATDLASQRLLTCSCSSILNDTPR